MGSASHSSAGFLPESEWGGLFAAMGDEYVEFGRRVQGEAPIRAYACYQGEGGGDPVWFDDAADIGALFDALAASGVSEEVGEVRSDDYTSFGFEFADGSTTSFMFESMTFMIADGGAWKTYAVVAASDLAAFADEGRAHTMQQVD